MPRRGRPQDTGLTPPKDPQLTEFPQEEKCLNQSPGIGRFRVEFDTATREVVVWRAFGVSPLPTMRREAIPSLEALAAEVAIHGHEAFLQHTLSRTLASAAISASGWRPAEPGSRRQALSVPDSTPVSQILRRGTLAAAADRLIP